MKKLLLLLLFISTYSYSQEEHFRFIGDDEIGNSFFLKVEKLNTKLSNNSSSTISEFWIKTIYKSSKNNGYQLQYFKLDCNNSTFSAEEYIIYDNKGQVKERKPSDILNQRVTPDSVVDKVRKYICK